MKIYRLAFHSRHEGLMLSWHTSKAGAAAARRALGRDLGHPQGVDEITEIHVPTDREGLVGWLNANFNRD